MRGCYGDAVNKDCRDGERFKYAVTLVGVQSLCAFLFIKMLDLIKPEEKDATHFGYYIAGSLANSSAMISSNMALRFVSYPMQVIFKAAKPIAVMTFGLCICKRYSIQRYIFVLLIVVGVIIFKLFESKEGKANKSIASMTNTTMTPNMTTIITTTSATPLTTTTSPNDAHSTTEWEQYTGIALLIFSLSMDGVLGAVQDRIKAAYEPTFRQMMLSFSVWCCIFITIIVSVNGEVVEVYNFANRHPQILLQLLSLGVAAAIGQLFIFTMVSSFGSLACSVTTTVRKFFSVVFSIIFFQNPSTLIQWVGAILVFSALLADAFYGKGRPKRDNEETKDTEMVVANENLLNDQPKKATQTAEIQNIA